MQRHILTNPDEVLQKDDAYLVNGKFRRVPSTVVGSLLGSLGSDIPEIWRKSPWVASKKIKPKPVIRGRYFPLRPKSVKTPPARYRWEPHRPAEVVQKSISLAPPTCEDPLQAIFDTQDLLDFHSYHFRQTGADRVEVTRDDKTPGNYLFTITYPERPARKVPTRISNKNP